MSTLTPAMRAPPSRAPAGLQQDGPNHLGLWYHVLLEHQMALITSCLWAAPPQVCGCPPVGIHNFVRPLREDPKWARWNPDGKSLLQL